MDDSGKSSPGQLDILKETSKACVSADSMKTYLGSCSLVDYEEEFNRFVQFTAALPNDEKEELHQILYPMFVYIYSTLLMVDKYEEAVKFYSYASLFSSFSGYSDKIKALFQLKTYKDIYGDTYFKLFWQQKYIIFLSEASFEKLQVFLMEEDSCIFLMLLHLCFSLEERSDSAADQDLLACRSDADNHSQPKKFTDATQNEETRKPEVLKIDQPATETTTASQSTSAVRTKVRLRMNEPATKTTKVRKSERVAKNAVASKNGQPTLKHIQIERSIATSGKLEHLKNISRKWHKTSSPLPFVLYVHNPKQSPTSAVLNRCNSSVACGYEDSSILVWNSYDYESEEEINDISVTKILDNKKSPWDASSSSAVAHFLHKTKKPTQVLKGNFGTVYGLSFISDPNYLISCSEDASVRLWSLQTSQNVASYSGHSSVVWDIDVSPRYFYFATSSEDSTLLLWDFNRSSPLKGFVGHQFGVSCVKFYHNDQYIASGSSDGTILLWTLNDNLPVRHLRGHAFGVSSITFSNNGKYLASGDNRGNMLIWDIASGLGVRGFQGVESRILDLSFNLSDSLLASCSLDETLTMWDVQSTTNEESSNRESKYMSVVSQLEVQAIPKFLSYDQNELLTVLAGVTY